LTAVVLTSELIRDYLLNYARSLIFTTSLSNANIVLAECSFDLLEDGTTKIVGASFRFIIISFKIDPVGGAGVRSVQLFHIPFVVQTIAHTIGSPQPPPAPDLTRGDCDGNNSDHDVTAAVALCLSL